MGFSRQEYAISFSRGSSQPRDQTCVSYLLCRQAGSLPLAPPGKPVTVSLNIFFHDPNHSVGKIWTDFCLSLSLSFLTLLNFPFLSLSPKQNINRFLCAEYLILPLFFLHHATCEIVVPHQRWNPCPRQWEHSLNHWAARWHPYKEREKNSPCCPCITWGHGRDMAVSRRQRGLLESDMSSSWSREDCTVFTLQQFIQLYMDIYALSTQYALNFKLLF